MDNQIRIKIYRDLNKGIIKFYRDVLERCNLGPYVKFWKKGNRLYIFTSDPAKGFLVGKNDTIQFSKPDYIAELSKFQGVFNLKSEGADTRMYYIDEDSRVVDRSNEKPKRAKTKFVNPVQSAKDDLKEIVDAKEAKGTLKEFVANNPVGEPILVKKPNVAENIVVNTLRDSLDECLDNDDLAGAKALLKAIRKFTGMQNND